MTHSKSQSQGWIGELKLYCPSKHSKETLTSTLHLIRGCYVELFDPYNLPLSKERPFVLEPAFSDNSAFNLRMKLIILADLKVYFTQLAMKDGYDLKLEFKQQRTPGEIDYREFEVHVTTKEEAIRLASLTHNFGECIFCLNITKKPTKCPNNDTQKYLDSQNVNKSDVKNSKLLNSYQQKFYKTELDSLPYQSEEMYHNNSSQSGKDSYRPYNNTNFIQNETDDYEQDLRYCNLAHHNIAENRQNIHQNTKNNKKEGLKQDTLIEKFSTKRNSNQIPQSLQYYNQNNCLLPFEESNKPQNIEKEYVSHLVSEISDSSIYSSNIKNTPEKYNYIPFKDNQNQFDLSKDKIMPRTIVGHKNIQNRNQIPLNKIMENDFPTNITQISNQQYNNSKIEKYRQDLTDNICSVNKETELGFNFQNSNFDNIGYENSISGINGNGTNDIYQQPYLDIHKKQGKFSQGPEFDNNKEVGKVIRADSGSSHPRLVYRDSNFNPVPKKDGCSPNGCSNYHSSALQVCYNEGEKCSPLWTENIHNQAQKLKKRPYSIYESKYQAYRARNDNDFASIAELHPIGKFTVEKEALKFDNCKYKSYDSRTLKGSTQFVCMDYGLSQFGGNLICQEYRPWKGVCSKVEDTLIGAVCLSRLAMADETATFDDKLCILWKAHDDVLSMQRKFRNWRQGIVTIQNSGQNLRINNELNSNRTSIDKDTKAEDRSNNGLLTNGTFSQSSEINKKNQL